MHTGPGTQTSTFHAGICKKNTAQNPPHANDILYIIIIYKIEDAWPFSPDAIQKIPPESAEAILQIGKFANYTKLKLKNSFRHLFPILDPYKLHEWAFVREEN